MVLNEEKTKRGRPHGAVTNNVYKWEVTIFDKNKNRFITDKCKSVRDINEKFNLNYSNDLIKRIATHERVDPDMKKKTNSFLARYGHIKITKIDEKIQNFN